MGTPGPNLRHPKIYLFELDGDVVWCEDDNSSPEGDAVAYVPEQLAAKSLWTTDDQRAYFRRLAARCRAALSR